MLCRSKERGEEVRPSDAVPRDAERRRIDGTIMQARQEIIKETGNEDVHLEVVDVSLQSSIRSFAAR